MCFVECKTIYNPINEPMRFKVYFDESEAFGYARQEQCERARRVISHLESLDENDIVEESIRFFKWIVLYPTSECNIHYAIRLLEYFHSRQLLTCKKAVNSTVKQQKPRYLVMFTFKHHVFSKTYNSIREIKADTGRKPSQIKCQHASNFYAVKV